ncbi:hypothetical protein JCM19376_41750 [Fusibacter bizertensis]
MNTNRIALLHTLFSIINENNLEDSNYILAKYFLDYYHHLSQLSIYEIAEDCYVSRASVRRFCQSIGYKNFIDLKNEFSKYDDQQGYYQKHASQENYREKLTEEINNMIKELDKRMDTDEIEKIVDKIYASKSTVFLTSDSSNGAIRDFQKAMIFNDKLVYIVSELYSDNLLLGQLSEDDFLITVSNTGYFALEVKEIVKACRAYSVLITVNRNPCFKDWFDKIYYLSGRDRSTEGGNVYGKYGISYMLDVFYSEYTRKYGTNQEREK